MCPHCETVFKVTDEQLSTAKGKVRCGLCHTVFTATPLLETTDIPDEKFLYDIKQTHQNLLLDEEIKSKVIPDEIRTSSAIESSNISSTVSWALGILLLLCTLVLESIWFNRDSLAQNLSYRPLIIQFCKLSGCTLAPVHAPDLIKIVNRNIYTHPNIKNALMVTVTMTNPSSHELEYPDIEIGFSNIRGELVAKRVFSPDEYIKIKREKLRLLQSNATVSFGLEIQDPGKQAMTFEFRFL